MKCYYQGCQNKGITKEHIPPKSFFPKGEKEQLLTVKSCEIHNNKKSTDDQYILAQICMNASPSNRAREVFLKKIEHQLDHNNGAFKRMLSQGSVALNDGAVKYPVDAKRFDEFFTALSCGVIFKTCDCQVPENYLIHHQYLNFVDEKNRPSSERAMLREFEQLISGEPLKALDFGKPNTENERIYTVKVFGMPGFKSSITVVHIFYGKFKVISLLTNVCRERS
ncbi:hypothetical protein EVC62_11745 [Salinicola endophyticus]|uniref:HNH endonuclease n=1 Tax=Salinicola endophyticus TaxID=1949083 RepID=A0ABY8FH27_9GAMM|nr:hypothetical protein [Salinicola endophyticus]WFF42122.1 hypothetical protein EVC62_11745 [Salinicola endophyticus]